MPGYGYAAVGKQRSREFNEAVAEFLSSRPNLRCAFVLIDSRLPPQAIDLEFIQWLEGTGVPFALIFTKTDKLSGTQARSGIDAFCRAVAGDLAEDTPIIATSAKTKAGRTDVLQLVAAVLAGGE